MNHIDSVDDYAAQHGKKQAVTIPGVLRGFRAFDVYDDNKLHSVIHNHDWKPEGNVASCDLTEVSFVWIRSGDCFRCVRNYFAPACAVVQSGAPPPGASYNMMIKCLHLPRQQINACIYHEPRHQKEPAPVQSCSCGFYGAYNLNDLHTAPGVVQTRAPIRGLVEASGKVILGTKGFRAERMKVVAIAAVGDYMGLVKDLGFPVMSYGELLEVLTDDVSVLLEG